MYFISTKQRDTQIMIKTIMLASFLMAFTFIAMPVSSAQAHCGTCSTEKSQTKPCEKTLSKKPCVKCLEAEAHYKATGEKKPCVKCAKAKAHYKSKATSSVDHSAKGSLTLKSRYGKTGGTASYN